MILLSKVVRSIARHLMAGEWQELRCSVHQLRTDAAMDPAGAPAWIAQAMLISGEDHRFFQHGGIDVAAVCRAVWRGGVLKRREGASTIEMQLVRVLTGRYERTVRRKIHEAWFATLLSEAVPKSEIPGLYLRVAYYGTRMEGYLRACNQLGLRPSDMSIRQAASLVARLKYPEPATCSERVTKLIEFRTAHLMRLHARHLETQAYHGLQRGIDYATI